MQNYSLLFLYQKNISDLKIVFPLHEGENIIGTNKDSDICLQLLEKDIEPIHAKITINKQKYLLDIGITILKSNKAYISKEGNRKLLIPGKEYELSKNCIFYLNDNIKFKLVKGTIDEIRTIFNIEGLENEFQKWQKKIINNDKEGITNINLYKINSCDLKNVKENRSNIIIGNNMNFSSSKFEIIKNEIFSIKKPKNRANEENKKSSSKNYLTESFSTSFSSNKFDKKRGNNINICKRNLLNLFNINLNEEKIDNILQENENVIRELLGEKGLDDIINCTNYKKIKIYDRLYFPNQIRKNKDIII